MKNKREVSKQTFGFSSIGNIKEGRGSLGDQMPVAVYRLMQFTMRDAIAAKYGKEAANEVFRNAGKLAGAAFASNFLDTNLDFDTFMASVAKVLMEMKIGVARIEKVSEAKDEIIITVCEDLDCSGLSVTGEVVCHYDEGFLAGILEVSTGKEYDVREIDCWATGDKTCRFKCVLKV